MQENGLVMVGQTTVERHSSSPDGMLYPDTALGTLLHENSI